MSKKKTHEEYIAEVAVKNPSVEVVGMYIGANEKIMHRCPKDYCRYEWYATPHNILAGKGCPKCTGKMKRTHDEYVKRVNLIHDNIEVIEKYIDNNTPILHKCVFHDFEWSAFPNNVLSGHGCRKCANDKMHYERVKNTNQYIEDLNKINSNIIIMGEYINAHTPILHKCLVDDLEWFAKPNNILSGKGCPKCSESKGEREIRQLLDSNEIVYESQMIFDGCFDIKPLPFDFYLPEYNLCIEYDGEQHYRPIEYFGGQKAFELRKKHDQIKNEYCKNNNIRLVRIPYFADVEEELNNFLFI